MKIFILLLLFFIIIFIIIIIFWRPKEKFITQQSSSESSCWPLTCNSSNADTMYFIGQIDEGYFYGYYDCSNNLITDLSTPFVICPSGSTWKATLTFLTYGTTIPTTIVMTFDSTTADNSYSQLRTVNYMIQFNSSCGHYGEEVQYVNNTIYNIQLNYNRIGQNPSGSACSDYKTSWTLPGISSNYYSNCNAGTQAFGGQKTDSTPCWPLSCNSSDVSNMYFIAQIDSGYFNGIYDCADNFISLLNTDTSSFLFVICPSGSTWKCSITFSHLNSSSPGPTIMNMVFDPTNPFSSPSTLQNVYFMVQFNSACGFNGESINFFNNTDSAIKMNYNRITTNPTGSACGNYATNWSLPAFATNYWCGCGQGDTGFGTGLTYSTPCSPKTNVDSNAYDLFGWIVINKGCFQGFYDGSIPYQYTSNSDSTVLTVQQNNWKVDFSPFNHDDNTCIGPNGLKITISSVASTTTATPPPEPVSLQNIFLMFQIISGYCGCTYLMLQFENQTSSNVIVNYNRLSGNPTTNACTNYQYQGVLNANSTMYAFCDSATNAFGFLQTNNTPCNITEGCYWNNLAKYSCITFAGPFAEADTTAACSTEWYDCEGLCAAALIEDPEAEAVCPIYCTSLEEACKSTLETGGILSAESLCSQIGL